MKHNSLRVTRMVQELMNFSFTIGATNINLNVVEDEKEYRITFKCNFLDCPEAKINKIQKLLKCGKNDEMEEYYWALAGESDTDSELSIVGMMSDKIEVNITPNEAVEILIWRYK